MKNNIFKRKLIIFILLSIITITFGITYGLGDTNSNTPLKVEENSELTYYLEILYDGNNKELSSSSDSTTIEMYSDYINVEDTLPNGLIFKRFIKSENESIGAVKRSDGSPCSGEVIGGFSGLSYDEQTRKVSFRVKDLKAGCKLTVGIVTETPSFSNYSVDRLDFYNTAYATEKNIINQSQTLHSYMQRANAHMYSVNYVYTGDVPSNVPSIPTTQYASGTPVGIENSPSVHGYTFSGWSSNDVTVSNGIFSMPNKDVTFTGSFTKIPDYKVTYKIEGDKPNTYTVPLEKRYLAGEYVELDSISKGKKIGEYIFNGWTIPNGITLNNNKFKMPSNDIVIVGSFKKNTYTVKYKFKGDYIPKNYSKLLPKTKSYASGEEVNIENINSNSVCKFRKDKKYRNCVFKGWDKKEKFIMPNENVVIYGEWKLDELVFTPSIEKTIVDEKKSYSKNQKVLFSIDVTNNDKLALYNVKLREKLKGARFISSTDYKMIDDQTVIIPKIEPNSKFTVYAEYIAGDDLYKKVTNEVTIMSVRGSNNSILNPDKKYVASVKFLVMNTILIKKDYKLNIIKVDGNGKKLDGSEFTLFSDETLNNSLERGLSFDNLKQDTTYYLKETIIPIGYENNNNIYKVIVNKDGIISIPGLKVDNKNGTGTVKIINNKKKEYVVSNPKTDIPKQKTVVNKKNKDYKPYIFGSVGTTGILFIIFIIFYRRKRTIMLYIPNIDVNNDSNFVNNYLSELDYDTLKNNKSRVIIMSNNNYYEFKDNKLKLIEYEVKETNKNMLLSEFITYSYKNYKAKRYNLVILNDIIDMTDLISGLKNSSFNEGNRLDSIILRYSIQFDNNMKNNLRNYAEYISYTKEGYAEFAVNKFLYTFNLINKRQNGEEVGKTFINQYNESTGSINSNNNSNYVIEKLDD